MKWQIKSMVDPGDGIVTTTVVERDTDDIVEVAADAFNGEIEGVTGFVFAVEALPPEDDE